MRLDKYDENKWLLQLVFWFRSSGTVPQNTIHARFNANKNALDR